MYPAGVATGGPRPQARAEAANAARHQCGEAKRAGSGRNADRRQSWRRQPPYDGCVRPAFEGRSCGSMNAR